MGKVLKQKNSLVYLEPIEHVYIHSETEERFTSVTKVIGSIEHKFESEKIAEAISKQSPSKRKPEYLGLNKNQILEYWQHLNDVANEYGTHLHELVEKYLFNNKYPIAKNDLEFKILDAYDNLDVDEGEVIWPERIMYSPEYKLAGTADLCIDIDDTFFDIGDWKGLPINTPIFTNSGWKTMGTLSKNDKVYDMNGELTNILHLSKIKNKKCYKINFDNNESIISDFEHRWLISFISNKIIKDVIMTTEELFKYTNDLNKRLSDKIPKIKVCKPLKNKTINNLPIDPYVLGVWLTKRNKININIYNEIKSRGYKIDNGKFIGIDIQLNELNLLNNKYLPDIYLMSSFEQRLDLLRGFMDINGYYNKIKKRFIMVTTMEYQVEIFNKLVSSLGIKITINKYKRNCIKPHNKIIDVFEISFNTNNLNPFLCKNQYDIIYGKSINLNFKNILSVEEVDFTLTRCIEVDSKTSTFLYGHTFSVTHNTNKKFNFFSPYGNTLLKPFEHLQECQYSVYSLQLSVYALMYEMETGKKCRQIWIGYWDRETLSFSKIPVMYMKNDAKKLLEFHKYNNIYEI